MTIDNSQDIINAEDIKGRIKELEETDRLDEYDKEELSKLKELEDDIGFDYELLIRESYFAEYSQELASDIYGINSITDWPFRHIDWDSAAEELQMDYSEVDFDGVTYFAK